MLGFSAIRNFDIKHQQGNSNGKDTIAECFHAPGFFLFCSKFVCVHHSVWFMLEGKKNSNLRWRNIRHSFFSVKDAQHFILPFPEMTYFSVVSFINNEHPACFFAHRAKVLIKEAFPNELLKIVVKKISWRNPEVFL